jgi:hypothetical protein
MLFGERTNERLSEFEQQRFREIMGILLFGKDQHFSIPDLNKKNVKLIGEKILDKYADFLLAFQDINFQKFARPNLTREEKQDFFEQLEKSRGRITEMIAGKQERNEEFLKVFFARIFSFLESSYRELAFSPAISDHFMGFNCFGYTQAIGALLIRAGFDVKIAIGVNHPFCYIELVGKHFLVSNYGVDEVHSSKINRESEAVPYFMSLSEDTEIDESVMIVTDFREGVVYEYLENLATLRNTELIKKTKNVLSNEFNHDQVVAMMHRELVGVDWQKVQGKIFPQIRSLFIKHAKDYDDEYKKMEDRYRRDYLNGILDKVFKGYFEVFYYFEVQENNRHAWDMYFKSRKSDMREAMILYGDEILEYIETGKKLNVNLPTFFTDFIYFNIGWIRELKNRELSEDLLKRFLNPITSYKEDLKKLQKWRMLFRSRLNLIRKDKNCHI